MAFSAFQGPSVSVGVEETDEGAALAPLKARSQDADVIPQLNIA